MMSELETYVGQLVTAGVPFEIAEVLEVFDSKEHDDPAEDTTTPRPRALWCRLFGASPGVFEARELRPALIERGTEFVAKDGGARPAVVLRHNSSDKDPVEISVNGHPPVVLMRREFLRRWRARSLAGGANA